MEMRTFEVTTTGSGTKHKIKATHFYQESGGVLQLLVAEEGDQLTIHRVKATFPAGKWDSCVEIEPE